MPSAKSLEQRSRETAYGYESKLRKDAMGQLEPVDRVFSSHKFCEYIAHELANPLNGMLMSAEIIDRYLAANPRGMDEIGDLTGILKREIKRLTVLVKELRSSRVLADIKLQPTSLPAAIRELLALQSAYYEQRRIRINQYVPSDLPPIMADADKLKQIVLNLCKNAADAMNNGGTLTLRVYAWEEWVCLDIADTGEGIPEAMPVFETYVTSKPQGSGLGLAIVREILKQHNGTISYTSQVGKGTTFHLKFPIQAG
jgi:signal transduction histidine kinase